MKFVMFEAIQRQLHLILPSSLGVFHLDLLPRHAFMMKPPGTPKGLRVLMCEPDIGHAICAPSS